jgi:uncharacterized protein (DUF4415 family)
MKDEDIDFSDIPPLDDSFFTKALVELPLRKDSITIRIDHNVLQWFKHQGKGYQTLINAILKAYVDAHHKNNHHKKRSIHNLRRDKD